MHYRQISLKAEILRRLIAQFGKICLEKTQAYDRNTKFVKGLTEVENTTYASRPLTHLTEENNGPIREILERASNTASC